MYKRDSPVLAYNHIYIYIHAHETRNRRCIEACLVDITMSVESARRIATPWSPLSSPNERHLAPTAIRAHEFHATTVRLLLYCSRFHRRRRSNPCATMPITRRKHKGTTASELTAAAADIRRGPQRFALAIARDWKRVARLPMSGVWVTWER